MIINHSSVRTLADTGCSKSCLRAEIPALTDIPITQENCQLLCANGDIVNATQSTELDVKIGNTTYKHSFVIVPGLSADAIIGVDLIKDLSFNQSDRFITLNGERIPLFEQGHETRGLPQKSHSFNKHSTYCISVFNPLHTDRSIETIITERLPKESKKRQFFVESSIHKNEKFINVMIRTKETYLIVHPRNSICLIKPVNVNPVANQIKFIKCKL